MTVLGSVAESTSFLGWLIKAHIFGSEFHAMHMFTQALADVPEGLVIVI